ncbi:MAG TPA: type II secretion system F family protein [Candidatus Dorea intestinavium]|nr:type II secretion system F family protein [Candidatus Dorea intestinavium]
MAKFKYKATDKEGKKIKGIIEANSNTEVYEKLKAQNLFMLEAEETGERGSGKRLKAKELSEFSRQIGTLLAAGVSLVRALSIIANDELAKPKHRAIYKKVLQSVRQGMPLSEAMEEQGEAFPSLIINMFRSAEASGDLDKVALRMANHYDKEHRMNTKIKNTMMYPLILMVLIVVVVIILFTFVIPQFEELFAQMGELPPLTRFVMAVSNVVVSYWWAVILGVAFLVLLIKIVLSIPKVRHDFDHFKLKIPVIGKLLSVIYTARFARTLSSLYSAGLPIVVALPIAASTIGNTYIEAQFTEVVQKVRRGENLSTSLESIDSFIKKMASAIMVGEETGSLDSMLDSIADELDYEAEMAISRLLTFLEPAMIIIMGIIVGIILISVMQPLYGSYSAIEGL